jgi:hypothetical protein
MSIAADADHPPETDDRMTPTSDHALAEGLAKGRRPDVGEKGTIEPADAARQGRSTPGSRCDRGAS